MKSILFNTEMVRAIMDGRKTVTRMAVKPHHLRVLDSPYHRKHPEISDKVLLKRLCEPPYLPGNTIYVRETWAVWSRAGGSVPEIHYKADGETLPGVKWRPSIHMPREAARLFLRVTDVRVERLNEITEEQAREEGAEPLMLSVDDENTPDDKRTWHEFGSSLPGFICLWNSAIKLADRARYGWDADPWVWVIKFERISREEALK